MTILKIKEGWYSVEVNGVKTFDYWTGKGWKTNPGSKLQFGPIAPEEAFEWHRKALWLNRFTNLIMELPIGKDMVDAFKKFLSDGRKHD